MQVSIYSASFATAKLATFFKEKKEKELACRQASELVTQLRRSAFRFDCLSSGRETRRSGSVPCKIGWGSGWPENQESADRLSFFLSFPDRLATIRACERGRPFSGGCAQNSPTVRDFRGPAGVIMD